LEFGTRHAQRSPWQGHEQRQTDPLDGPRTTPDVSKVDRLAAGNLEPRRGPATDSRRRRSPPSFASAALPTIPLTARTAPPPRSCSRCTTLNASSAASEARFRSPSSGEPAGPSAQPRAADAARVRAGPADAGGAAPAGRTGRHKEDL